MDREGFWKLIEEAKGASKGDVDQQLAALERALSHYAPDEILTFDRILHEFMSISYTNDLWAAAYIINGGCSDDGFDYFRGWLIAQGQDTFFRALGDPETLVDVVGTGEVELEELLSVAWTAYENRTATPFPLDMLPPV